MSMTFWAKRRRRAKNKADVNAVEKKPKQRKKKADEGGEKE